MDVSAIIKPLNDAQRLAVSAPQQAMLVLAGAGSGKTRVLVHRIAWQMQVNGLSPQQILAVTFTNKAAREMRSRIEELLEISTHSMWIGTFHGLAHRLLRQHARQAGLPETFQVMDSDDQLRVVKRIARSMNLDDGKWPPKQLVWYINAQKEEGLRARHIADDGDLYGRQLLTVYRTYEEFCQRSGLVDFAELLLRTLELLRDNAELLAFYRHRFQAVHVDEFQDTNNIQYAWLRLLTEGNDNLFVVGDDDQSIYGWRGAKIENIFSFQKHFPSHQIIRLEQNYRSTGHILHTANILIAHNDGRMGKELWTEAGEGQHIGLYAAFNEQDEAYFVVEKIRQWQQEGGLRSEVAILYRSNAQSRQFEERLMTTAVPYRVYGGLRFFERLEIKNALAYLRLASNPHDDTSFERVVNLPARGLGPKTLDDMRMQARERQCSLWQAAQAMLAETRLPPRAGNALGGFLQLLESLGRDKADLPLHELIRQVIERSGLLALYQNDKQDKNEARAENLEELVNAARLFDFDSGNDENLGELDMFLAHAALEAGENQAEPEQDCVQLMTLHAAKGLEFKLVFMVGVEEGLFPAMQSLDDPARLQEERRLCYVGITRAMEQLYLTHAESRRLYGKDSYPRPSRFIREMPAASLQEIRLRPGVTRPAAGPAATAQGTAFRTGRFRPGQNVGHDKFGEGVVLQSEGEGDQERVQINFRSAGIKWLLLAYARLQSLD